MTRILTDVRVGGRRFPAARHTSARIATKILNMNRQISRLTRFVKSRADSLPRSIASLSPRRRVAAARLEREVRLHLGCGSHLLEGWANVDLSGPGPVIELDLTLPLPARSDAFDLVYCEHFIEHITLEQARGLIGECFRVLRKGGVFRVSTPDLQKLVEEYKSGRLDEWHDVHWTPKTPCRLLNEGMRLWGHEFLYDRAELASLLEAAGFGRVVDVGWRESEHVALRGLECRPFHNEIILECTK